MKTEFDWDYTRLAGAYMHRPGYSDDGLDRVVEVNGLGNGAPVLDLGAGTGHLTVALAARGLDVVALEPNDRMRAHGVPRTAQASNVRWVDALMEDTHQPDASFDMVSYGSSFGVTDRAATLREAARVLRSGGWFVCMWNHRDLEDPLQRAIEALIHNAIPGYDYGTRRRDPSPVIAESGLFGPAQKLEAPVEHVLPTETWIAAWGAHATLQRQAGADFDHIVAAIADLVRGRTGDTVTVPYTTRLWMCPLLPAVHR